MNKLIEWNKLRRKVTAGISLTATERLGALESFRAQLVAACGEEPAILMGMGTEVALADYLAWGLQAKHGAVYCREGEDSRCLARFGNTAGQAEECRVPIEINEELWGTLALGPKLTGEAYDAGDRLYLTLFGLSVVSCLERRRNGAVPRRQAYLERSYEALREAEQMWAALRPRDRQIRLVIEEPESEAASALQRFFQRWGFEAQGDRIGLHESCEGDVRLKALTHEIILEAPALDERQVFPKPCPFPLLARSIFEAGLGVVFAANFSKRMITG